MKLAAPQFYHFLPAKNSESKIEVELIEFALNRFLQGVNIQDIINLIMVTKTKD